MADTRAATDLPERAAVVVIGAGIMGAAAAWQLAARGIEVVVLEQFEPATEHGSSHGSARIVRRAYPQTDYVDLTGEAFELWRELEVASGQVLVRLSGAVDHGRGRDVTGIARVLAKAGVSHELISGQEAEQRFDGMRFAGPVLHHEQAGTLDAARAVSAFLRVAAQRGCEVHTRTIVEGIDPGDNGAVVRTNRGNVHARHVVVAAGAWCAGLLGGLVELPPLTVTEHRVFHFPRVDETVTWPVTIHRDALDIYHLPGGRDGGPGGARKLAQHVGRPSDPRNRDPQIDIVAREQAVRYVREWLPGLVPTPFGETTCLYTTTPNEDFVIDRVGPLVVASACSGHGAKLAPVVGRLVADHVTLSAPPHPRFALVAHRSG